MKDIITWTKDVNQLTMGETITGFVNLRPRFKVETSYSGFDYCRLFDADKNMEKQFGTINEARRAAETIVEREETLAVTPAKAEHKTRLTGQETVTLRDANGMYVVVKISDFLEGYNGVCLFGMSLEVILALREAYEERNGKEPMTVESVREVFNR